MKGRQHQTMARQAETLAYRFNGGKPTGRGPSAGQDLMAPNKPNCRGFRPENRVGRKNKPNGRAWPARRRERGCDGAKQSQSAHGACRQARTRCAKQSQSVDGACRQARARCVKQSQFCCRGDGGHAPRREVMAERTTPNKPNYRGFWPENRVGLRDKANVERRAVDHAPRLARDGGPVVPNKANVQRPDFSATAFGLRSK